MKQQELEASFIRSLDVPMTDGEKEAFHKAMQEYPELGNHFAGHKKVRDLLAAKKAASFGPYFASKLLYKIENAGVMIDRQIFSFFRKFQLAAMGVIVGLLILNVIFTDDGSITSIFGIDRTVTPAQEEDVPFDFFDTLNKTL